MLGIQIDSDLTFDKHMSSICNKVGKKINVLSRLALKIVSSDYKSSFCGLLEKDKPFSIHYKNIQGLAIEIYKFLHNLSS